MQHPEATIFDERRMGTDSIGGLRTSHLQFCLTNC